LETSKADSVFQNEAERIISAAQERGIILRLLGALAIRYHTKPRNLEERSISDLDFIGLSKQRKEIEALFSELGYLPYERFNFTHGYQRLVFFHGQTDHRVDVFFDVFEMCHKFDFRNRLIIDDKTLSVSDLVATKLQIVEINEKDIRDLFYLFIDNDLADDDSQRNRINKKYIGKLCSDDWGIWKTFTLNLEKIPEYLTEFLSDTGEQEVVRARLKQLKETIDAEPKSLRWKMRAKVGEKKQWYTLPDTRTQM
jgi:hypothetical protein